MATDLGTVSGIHWVLCRWGQRVSLGPETVRAHVISTGSGGYMFMLTVQVELTPGEILCEWGCCGTAAWACIVRQLACSTGPHDRAWACVRPTVPLCGQFGVVCGTGTSAYFLAEGFGKSLEVSTTRPESHSCPQ